MRCRAGCRVSWRLPDVPSGNPLQPQAACWLQGGASTGDSLLVWAREVKMNLAVTAFVKVRHFAGPRATAAGAQPLRQVVRQEGDANRLPVPGCDLAAIPPIPEKRVVAKTTRTAVATGSTSCWCRPTRGGGMVIELLQDESLAVRFRAQFLKYREVAAGSAGRRCPQTPGAERRGGRIARRRRPGGGRLGGGEDRGRQAPDPPSPGGVGRRAGTGGSRRQGAGMLKVF
jgi:hypothetical protein